MEETREAMTTGEQAAEPAETGMQKPQEPEAAHEEKTFTKDEVNDIVRRRLAKEREKFTALMDSEGEKRLIEREKAVLKRELRADALDRFKEAGLPASLADLVDYADEESYNASFERVRSVFEPAIKEAVARARTDMLRGVTPSSGTPQPPDKIREAFRPKV